MTSPFTPEVACALGVRLLPPEEAHDFERWAGRLANPGLLRDAVAVALYRFPLLAVPVGEGRRGGQLHVLGTSFAEEAVVALDGRPGFPRLFARGPLVEWGDRPLELSNARARQEFYGLRDLAEDDVGSYPIRPPAGHGGYGSEAGRWPPTSEQLRTVPPPDGTVPIVAASPLP
ncbi:DUF6302 family protein [Streptomyces sp. NBC_01527]|uniref:DUF6302 family protein n=1 Tax=Streptomyces sp. NBC_01527 TaxID=2903894 RepID=UPI00386B445B